MALSGQQLLLGSGNANIHNQSIPVATARKAASYPPTCFFSRFIYSLKLSVIQNAYHPRCNLDEIIQVWCSGDCTGHHHRGWRGCMAARRSKWKAKLCPVSHLGGLSNKQMPTSPGRPPPHCRFWVCESLQLREKWDSQQMSLSRWVSFSLLLL